MSDLSGVDAVEARRTDERSQTEELRCVLAVIRHGGTLLTDLSCILTLLLYPVTGGYGNSISGSGSSKMHANTKHLYFRRDPVPMLMLCCCSLTALCLLPSNHRSHS